SAIDQRTSSRPQRSGEPGPRASSCAVALGPGSALRAVRDDNAGQCDLPTCSGFPLRLVWAIFLSSFSLIDIIDLDAPWSLDLGVSPRLAESAAPAAFCWAADLAGMGSSPLS